MAAAEVMAILRANTSEFSAKIGAAKAELEGMSREGSSNFSKLATVGQAALLGVGAAAVGVGIAAIDFGDKQEKAQNQLQAALQASGQSWNSVRGSVSQAGADATKYGYTQAQVDSALASGVISTQSYSKAHMELGVAIQLAAAKHIDLQSAMTAVEKAANGQLRPLKQLGIDLPVAAGGALKVKTATEALATAQGGLNLLIISGAENAPKGSKAYLAYEAALAKVHAAQDKLNSVSSTGQTILTALQQRMSGQASAAANTLEGRVAALRAQGENLAANLGQHLIPILEKVVSFISRAVTWFEKHATIAKILAGIIGGVLVAAIAAMTVAWIADAAATLAATWPLLAIIAAIAAVAAAAIYLATHWHQVWTDIKNWFNDALNFLRSGFGTLVVMLTGPFAPLIELGLHWKTVWGIVKDVVSVAWAIIKPIFDFIKDYLGTQIKNALTALQAVFQVVWVIISTAVQVAWAIIKPIWDLVYNVLSNVIPSAINALQTIWDGVWGAVSGAVTGAWGLIQPVWDAITGFLNNAFTSALNAAGTLWSGFWNGLTTVVSGVTGGIKAAINGVIDIINGMINAFDAATSWVPGVPHVADIPHLAMGGALAAGQLALVGERGPELFVPPTAGTIVPNSALGTSGGAGAGPTHVHLNATFELGGVAFMQALQTFILQYQRGAGPFLGPNTP